MSGQSNPPQRDTLNISTLRNGIQAMIFDAAADYANNGSRNFYNDADQILTLLKEHINNVIGADWPKHCDKGFDYCNQCRNREVLNGQLFEQRANLERLIGR